MVGAKPFTATEHHTDLLDKVWQDYPALKLSLPFVQNLTQFIYLNSSTASALANLATNKIRLNAEQKRIELVSVTVRSRPQAATQA